MKQNKLEHQAPQPSRGHHMLTACNIGDHASLDPPRPQPERKARRKSTANLIATAKRAGLTVTKLNPDGSVSTATSGLIAATNRADTNKEIIL